MKQSAQAMKESRDYVAAHEDKLRKRLTNGETYVELSAQLGISINVLRRMLEIVLPERRNIGVHPPCICEARKAREVRGVGAALLPSGSRSAAR
ncbi:hypothetical protein J7I97_16935 [Streptomyces sp. ISL-87]|nr:hypothetical protein [Streptomyces sp. ISL-87]